MGAEGFADLLVGDGLIAVHRDTLLEVYDTAPWGIVHALLVAESEGRMLENRWCELGKIFAIRKPEPPAFEPAFNLARLPRIDPESLRFGYLGGIRSIWNIGA